MRKNMWEIKQAASENTLDLFIYGDVEGDSYDWWTDEVIRSETSANFFREELAKYPNVTSILMAALYLRALRFITSSNATPRTRRYMWMVLPAQSLLSLQWRETP